MSLLRLKYQPFPILINPSKFIVEILRSNENVGIKQINHTFIY